MSFSKLDYCQYLLSSPVNYTLTHLSQHLEGVSHDRINRYLRGEVLTPRLRWENVERVLEPDEDGFVIFDDTVLNKEFGPHIAPSRRQWSGNEHGIVNGIGLVSCVYVNATSGHFWVVDYRIFDPDSDGMTKLDHVLSMLEGLRQKKLPFRRVLMDTWYATQKIMLDIDGYHRRKNAGAAADAAAGAAADAAAGAAAGAGAGAGAAAADAFFYCPLKSDRLVDDSGGVRPYRHVDSLEWSEDELQSGKVIKVRGFPGSYKVRLFRVAVFSDRTEWLVTNEPTCASTQDAQQVRAVRWKIEEYHRELKQLTGIQSCQCRTNRIQRNHIACALLVWTRLKDRAYKSACTIYFVKNNLLHDYLVQQLKTPTVQMVLA